MQVRINTNDLYHSSDGISIELIINGETALSAINITPTVQFFVKKNEVQNLRPYMFYCFKKYVFFF